MFLRAVIRSIVFAVVGDLCDLKRRRGRDRLLHRRRTIGAIAAVLGTAIARLGRFLQPIVERRMLTHLEELVVAVVDAKFGEQLSHFEEANGLLTFEAPKDLNLKVMQFLFDDELVCGLRPGLQRRIRRNPALL